MPAGTGEQRHLRRFTILYIKKQSVRYRILRSYKDTLHGPSVEIRTQGLLNPIQARYQTSPHPDFLLSVAVSRRLVYNSTVGNGMQVFFSLFSVFSKFLSSHPLPHPFCQNRPPFPLFSPGRLGKKLDSILCSVLHSVQKIFLLEMLQIVHNFRKNLLFLLPALPFSNCFTVRWQKF